MIASYSLNEQLLNTLDNIYAWVWGLPLMGLIVGLGLYLTWALRGLQFRYLSYGLRLAFGGEHHGDEKGDISHFQSLMTALAATIGIGNIAGVATAVTAGGMGALFWMWVTALLGMAIKYAEALLAVKYRIQDEWGEMAGGPMFFIERGLHWHWLAVSFAVFGAIAALGGGNMLQANSVADVLVASFDIDPWWVAIGLAFLAGLTLLGGIQSIGAVAGFVVPVMGLGYISCGLLVLFKYYHLVPGVLWTIFDQAFTGKAVAGGAIGSAVLFAIQVGVARGLMTSESGLGTASIAAAAAKTDTPGRQAMVSMTGSFIATVVMCTITALVLGCTGVLGAVKADGQIINGAALTRHAFQTAYPWGGYVVTIATVFFGFTTLIGWAYYGEKCVEYLVGLKGIRPYRLLFTVVIIPGAVLDLDIVWKMSDIANGLMALPNLIGICALVPVIVAETKQFLELVKSEES